MEIKTVNCTVYLAKHFILLYLCPSIKSVIIMGYSYYKNIRTVVKKFNLDVQMVNLFDEVIPLEPSTWLVQSLEKAGKMPATNEKTKAERVISPILLSVFENYSEQISFFFGRSA